DTLENLANVCPGTYTITVWDSTGFSMVESVTVSTVHNEVTVAATSTGATCELANGTIALAISGGIPPYTNYWTPWLLSQGTNITNIAAGTYLLHVEGENGCGDTLTITVLGTPALALDISFDAATCELANGDIDLTILTGTPPFQYVWSNGAITQDLVGVPTGLYNVDVTDSAGCTKSGFKFVPGSPAIQAIITPHAYCDSATGRITTQVYTGTLPYAFAWSNGSSQQHPHGLSLGVDYTVTITDAVGCTNVQTTPLHAAVAPATPVLQPDVNDNYLYAPPHPNYVYYWFVDGTLDLSANAYVHEMDTIFGGVYSVIVVDTSTHCSSDTSAGYAVIVDTYANVAYPTLYLTVFPNPAINEINFVVNCGGSLSLSDMFGRRIESRMFEGEAIHKIGNLDCGLYNYRFVSRSGETLSGKCLVVKD
ncbi:MAG TPA: hypothetical protein VEY71_03150, partial [Chitinophagales bacterium]|nr:hypothetical protein [Chitinophagales bacterium]